MGASTQIEHGSLARGRRHVPVVERPCGAPSVRPSFSKAERRSGARAPASARRPDSERLEFIKLLGRIHVFLRSYNGDDVAGAIMHQVWAGSVEGREWDITSLAESLRVPRQTVSRKIHKLEAMGWLERGACGRRTHLRPTPAFVTWAGPRLDALMAHTRSAIPGPARRPK